MHKNTPGNINENAVQSLFENYLTRKVSHETILFQVRNIRNLWYYRIVWWDCTLSTMQEQDPPIEKSWRCSIGMASGCHEGSETIEYDPVDNGARYVAR